jgi:type II secretory pathway pseudopilin PulG
MILTFSRKRAAAAMTLVEMSVSIGVLGLLGVVFFEVLQSGLVLSAKNTAVNAAHEEARQGVMRLTRDIHASVSVPQLRDTNFAVVSATPNPSTPSATPPTAAGVSFQNIAAGPNYIFTDPDGNNGLIMIADGPTGQPSPGMRMIIPAWGIEDDIMRVTGAKTARHSNVFTASNFETNVKRTPAYAGSLYAIAYYTDRVMYLVQNGRFIADSKGDHNLLPNNQYVQVPAGTGQFRYEGGELHYYRQRSTSSNPSVAGTLAWQSVAVVARNISSPRPFSVPLNTKGGTDNKFVKVQLSARDPKSTNRGYRATAALLDTAIDYRARITTFQ